MYLPAPFRRSVPKRLDAQIAKRSVCLGDVALCNGAGWLAGWGCAGAGIETATETAHEIALARRSDARVCLRACVRA